MHVWFVFAPFSVWFHWCVPALRRALIKPLRSPARDQYFFWQHRSKNVSLSALLTTQKLSEIIKWWTVKHSNTWTCLCKAVPILKVSFPNPGSQRFVSSSASSEKLFLRSLSTVRLSLSIRCKQIKYIYQPAANSRVQELRGKHKTNKNRVRNKCFSCILVKLVWR